MGQPPIFVEAVQPTKEGLARKELKQKKMQQFSRDSVYSSNKDSTCLLTEILWGLVFYFCLLSLVQFLLVLFSDSGMFPLGAECCFCFQQFSINRKSGPSGNSGSGCHCFVQIREALALESRKTQLFLGHCLVIVYLFILSKVAIAAKDYQFQIPSTKHVNIFNPVHSQPAY